MAGIEITKICPYCSKRPILRKTCGHALCQIKRHILKCRETRKTDQVRNTRQKI